MTETFTLGSHEIGQSGRPFLIAEVGQAHDGSLGMAHSYIDLAKDVGVDAIKFQTHIADAESTYDEEFRVNFSYEDKTRFGYWNRMEFTPEQWFGLMKHAEVAGLVFLSTAFSRPAVDLLRKMDIAAWKAGSGDLTNHDLLGYMAEDAKPVLISTGMALDAEIDETIQMLKGRGCPYGVFQCTSKYPTPLEYVGLNILEELQARLDAPVGLSDHSGDVHPALLAMARGADLVELHITFHKGCFGPDSVASLTPDQFRQVVQARDAFYVMDQNPVRKNEAAGELDQMRYLFNRSFALVRDLPAGSRIEEADLALKKPGGGIPASEKEQIIGKVLKQDVQARRLLREDDLIESESAEKAHG